jgi:D-serine deaminase-like pyridoxal phosphate-dependent protein
VRLAELIAATEGVELAGVSSYEGGLPTAEAVRGYFAGFKAIAERLRAAGLLAPDAIVTTGGSAYFDIVASEFTPEWADGFRVILRSGAYVSHDDGVYVRKTPFRRVPEEGALIGAIEVWAQVVSAPEPGFALVGMGKRDAPYDEGMPVPHWLRRAGTTELIDVREVAEVPKLDDQHGYLRFPAELAIRPGDLIGFGISHPCTAFDKWRAVPVVDDEDRIVDVFRTYF